jgi:hypothetical protein
MGMSESRGLLELSYTNAEVSNQNFDDFVVYGVERGIPKEILTRMSDLWEKTKEVGGEIIQVGRIVVVKIFEFLKANPQVVTTLAIGSAVYFLTSAIPLIGPLLAPLTTAAMALAVFASQTDIDGLVKLANDFFRMLVEIFNAVSLRWA